MQRSSKSDDIPNEAEEQVCHSMTFLLTLLIVHQETKLLPDPLNPKAAEDLGSFFQEKTAGPWILEGQDFVTSATKMPPLQFLLLG